MAKRKQKSQKSLDPRVQRLLAFRKRRNFPVDIVAPYLTKKEIALNKIKALSHVISKDDPDMRWFLRHVESKTKFPLFSLADKAKQIRVLFYSFHITKFMDTEPLLRQCFSQQISMLSKKYEEIFSENISPNFDTNLISRILVLDDELYKITERKQTSYYWSNSKMRINKISPESYCARGLIHRGCFTKNGQEFVIARKRLERAIQTFKLRLLEKIEFSVHMKRAKLHWEAQLSQSEIFS